MNTVTALKAHAAPRTAADEIIEYVRQHGGRASTALRVLVETLSTAGGHRTAEQLADEIHAAHPDIHQSTIYRNLDRLEAIGVAYHSHLGHGPAQWHLGAEHHHLTCQICGQTIDAHPALFENLQPNCESASASRSTSTTSPSPEDAERAQTTSLHPDHDPGRTTVAGACTAEAIEMEPSAT